MNYGLYLSASGVLTNLYRMDVASNNLANLETTGFKPIVATLRQRDAARIEDGLVGMASNAMLEKLGAGVMLMPNAVSMTPGAPERTGRELDVAIDGPGFFVLRAGETTGNATDSVSNLRMSRDGRLTLDSQGRLVQASSGLAVLGIDDRPIVVPGAGRVNIDPSGRVSQNNQEIGRLQIATISDPTRLRPVGDGLFAGPPLAMARRQPAAGSLVQSTLERSAVDPVRAMLDVAAAERAVGSNTRLIQFHDQILDRAINTFGRVA